MKNLLLLIFLICFGNLIASENFFQLLSPDSTIKVQLNFTAGIKYSLFVSNDEIMKDSKLDLVVDSYRKLSDFMSNYNCSYESVNQSIVPVVANKNSVIEDKYNQLKVELEKFVIEFRAYDDGFAYRIMTKFKNDITIDNEVVEVNFSENYKTLFPEEKSFITHQERNYRDYLLNEITSPQFCSLPLLINANDKYKILMGEADLINYPGMYYKGTGSNTLLGLFPAVVKSDSMKNDRTSIVKERENYIARIPGEKALPWRTFTITREDKDLIETQMVYKLASPNRLENVKWIKPGKVAWDWWNANNIYKVDFEAGVNTETYKHYIDFASANNIEYIILDEGWYVLGNLLKLNTEINMEEILAHAKNKNVGVILWVVWKTLDDQFKEAFDQFEKWSIMGIKVDFMQRDDQWMVNYYWRVAEEAAKRKMLVDFHGSYTPRGLERTYPNVITCEGVQGLEHYKWESEQGPDHELTLPFIRMAAGPMDFTPGAMLNRTNDNFRVVFNQPMSKGTRSHQMAMYVLYESPLQMLADSPTHYNENSECLKFLSQIPTVWDKTIALEGKVGDYLVMARKNNDDWYIGAMTDWTAREFKVTLDFLEEGKYEMTLFKDGPNAERNGEDYRCEKVNIHKGDIIELPLAQGGGFAARLEKIKEMNK